jgi:hypothetical protein
MMVAEDVLRVIRGEIPKNLVNPGGPPQKDPLETS